MKLCPYLIKLSAKFIQKESDSGLFRSNSPDFLHKKTDYSLDFLQKTGNYSTDFLLYR